MKKTIIIDAPKSNLPLVLNAAVAAVLSGNDDGTYGLGGKKKGDFTLATWPKNGIDCLACAGSAFTLPPSGAQIEVVPLLAMEPEQADALRKAVEAKDHASYLCYMLLRRLDQAVSLKQVLDLASKKEWCPDDMLSEFFGDTGINDETGEPIDENAGCGEAEGHTIPSLLAMWQTRTDEVMRLVSVASTDTQ